MTTAAADRRRSINRTEKVPMSARAGLQPVPNAIVPTYPTETLANRVVLGPVAAAE
jgi:hypothetical protein